MDEVVTDRVAWKIIRSLSKYKKRKNKNFSFWKEKENDKDEKKKTDGENCLYIYRSSVALGVHLATSCGTPVHPGALFEKSLHFL